MGQNPKIWLLWRPVAPQPYLLEKSWPISETPWPCTTTWSKQYLSAVHPVTCSLLWVRHLFDRFSISDFGGKWPIKWKFSKMSFRIPQQDTDIRFVTTFGENRSLRSCRKSLWITAQKKLGLRGTHPSLHFAQNVPIASKLPRTLSPLDMSTYTEFGPDRLRFARLIPKILIFRPQK